MKSVLLVNPPLTMRVDAPRAFYPPLGLGYIAATLRMGNFEVDLMDCPMEGDLRETPAGPRHVRIGLSGEEIENRIGQYMPTIVAISCMAADQAENAHLVAAAVKRFVVRKGGDIFVAVGGGYATTDPERVMADENVDFAIVGEGETPMFNLCTALRNRRPLSAVEGLVYRDQWGRAIRNKPQSRLPDVDQFPVPARDLMKMKYYVHQPSYYFEVMTPHTQMVLSRGCPSQCAFCSVPRDFGVVLRKRSVDRIIEELSLLREEFGLREVEFVGDNLFHDREWAQAWMNAIARKHSDLNWSPLSGQSLLNFDLDMANRAVRSGLRSIMFDVSSLNETIYQDAYRRPGDLSTFRELVRFLKGEGVKVGGLFTVGAPGETKATMSQTVSSALSLGLHEVRVRAMTPYPGTPLWDECEEKGWFHPRPEPADLLKDWGFIKTDQLTPRLVSWQRDWAERRLATRRLFSAPDQLAERLGAVVFQAAMHPIIGLKHLYRYLTLMMGAPLDYRPPESLPEERRAPAGVPSAAPAAPPEPETPAAAAPAGPFRLGSPTPGTSPASPPGGGGVPFGVSPGKPFGGAARVEPEAAASPRWGATAPPSPPVVNPLRLAAMDAASQEAGGTPAPSAPGEPASTPPAAGGAGVGLVGAPGKPLSLAALREQRAAGASAGPPAPASASPPPPAEEKPLSLAALRQQRAAGPTPGAPAPAPASPPSPTEEKPLFLGSRREPEPGAPAPGAPGPASGSPSSPAEEKPLFLGSRREPEPGAPAPGAPGPASGSPSSPAEEKPLIPGSDREPEGAGASGVGPELPPDGGTGQDLVE